MRTEPTLTPIARSKPYLQPAWLKRCTSRINNATVRHYLEGQLLAADRHFRRRDRDCHAGLADGNHPAAIRCGNPVDIAGIRAHVVDTCDRRSFQFYQAH